LYKLLKLLYYKISESRGKKCLFQEVTHGLQIILNNIYTQTRSKFEKNPSLSYVFSLKATKPGKNK